MSYSTSMSPMTASAPVVHAPVLGAVPMPPLASIPVKLVTIPAGPSVADLQVAGACDWYKIQKLMEAEGKLIHLLKKDGLMEPAMKLDQMREDVLSHRMANSPFSSAKVFLRNNCGNDAFIGKFRNDIDAFDRALSKLIVKQHVIPRDAIELRYHSQLLRQQARASLPFTGYYNATPVAPSVAHSHVKDLPYIPRFVLPPFPETTVLSSFL